MRISYADSIKDRVPLIDLLEFYGFHPVYNRMPCPFHNGKDRNMLVSNNFYKCFVCGEHGDIFTFVQKYWGLDFQSAVSKINEDLNLGFPIGKKVSYEERKKAEQQEAERRRINNEKRRHQQELYTKYDEALTTFTACDTILTRCAPISPSTGFSDAFCWAAKNIDKSWYELKEAERNQVEFSF